MTIGLEEFRDPGEQRLDRMLAQPFRGKDHDALGQGNREPASRQPKDNDMTFAISLFAIVLLSAALAGPARAENPAVKAMQEYMEFAPYEAGIIVPQQLAKDVFESVVFIDTRDAGQFAKGSIPGSP